MTAAYPRHRRIVKTDEFSSVFRLRPVRKTAHFMLYSRVNGLANARLGIVAAKRLAPRAATRNAIKRTAREVFRHAPLPSVDCVVRLSKPVNARSGPAVTAALKRLLRQEIVQLFRLPFPDGGVERRVPAAETPPDASGAAGAAGAKQASSGAGTSPATTR